MVHVIIDRRKNAKGKSSVNRQKFVKRVREQVKEAVKDVIRDSDIKDVNTGKNKKVKIPGKGLDQPQFHHDKDGGIKDYVHPGNREYEQGDRIARPQGGGGGGGGGDKASKDGEGEDEFGFSLTRDEFLDMFFEDLELPDLVKKDIAKVEEWITKRAGFAVDGSPSRLNILRTMKTSKTRRLALRAPKKRKLKELEKELELLADIEPKDDDTTSRIVELKDQIRALKRQIRAIPFIDDIDLRFNRYEKVPQPSTQAVMFCLMDVSASMGNWDKEMAKRFFMLLYLFLIRNYERVDIIFVRHHVYANEVDEHEFFHGRATGGTIVSSGLQMILDIIKERYNPTNWNIFVSQASDGDNWGDDTPRACELLEQVLDLSQYYAYVEIDKRGGKDSDLWASYEAVAAKRENFVMSVISDVNEIYPVFRRLFEKRSKKASEVT